MPGKAGNSHWRRGAPGGLFGNRWYDLVADDEVIPGPVPGAEEVFAGVGWRGTGYKFAPRVGQVLAQLTLQQGTGYDIRRFAPARSAGGSGAGGLKAGGAVS